MGTLLDMDTPRRPDRTPRPPGLLAVVSVRGNVQHLSDLKVALPYLWQVTR